MHMLRVLHSVVRGPVAEPGGVRLSLRDVFGLGVLRLAQRMALSAAASLMMGVQYRLDHPALETVPTISQKRATVVVPVTDRHRVAEPNDRAALQRLIVEAQEQVSTAKPPEIHAAALLLSTPL